MLTALSVLGTSKKYLQKGADILLKKCAKKNNTRVPHDVLRREAVLDEHAITKRNGGRRISTVLQLGSGEELNSGGEFDGDIELSSVEIKTMHSTPLREEGMVETSDAANSAVVIKKMQEEIKEQKKEIKEQKKEIKEQKKEIDSLKENVALLMKLSTHKNPRVEVKEDHPSSDTAVSSIKDAKNMHKYLHWNKFKKIVKASNSFKSSSSSSRKKYRSKRLSTVIKARRNSVLGKKTTGDNNKEEKKMSSSSNNNNKRRLFRIVENDEDGGANYFVDIETNEIMWEMPEDGELV